YVLSQQSAIRPEGEGDEVFRLRNRAGYAPDFFHSSRIPPMEGQLRQRQPTPVDSSKDRQIQNPIRNGGKSIGRSPGLCTPVASFRQSGSFARTRHHAPLQLSEQKPDGVPSRCISLRWRWFGHPWHSHERANLCRPDIRPTSPSLEAASQDPSP